MSSNPKVSVIMATYREEESFLRAAIESILEQTYSDFVFLIGADDPENEKLIHLLSEYEQADDRIKIYINEKNLGLAKTLNALLEHVDTPYVARMDADDISDKNRLSHQLQYLCSQKLDLIASDVCVIDEKGNIIQRMTGLPADCKKIYRKLKYNNCMPHPTWFAKAEIYKELDGYTDTPYCEDYDFLLRARNQGFQLGNLNEELLQYRMSTGSISRSNLYRQYLSMKYCQQKYIKKKPLYWQEFLQENFDSAEEERYIKSANAFTDGLRELRKKRIFKGILLLTKAFFGSKCYRDKMIKYVQQVIG